MTNQRAPNHPSTNAAIRQRYVDGKTLNDGAPLNTATVSPGNGSDTTPAGDTDIHVVNPDGTNSVKLGNLEEAGRVVTIVHNGGSNTPTLSFSDSDFVNTGPSNITTKGATATLINVNGNSDGFVVLATGSG